MQRLVTPRYSLVIPVYKNEGSIAPLLKAIEGLVETLDGVLEAVFVVDGSPDASFMLLESGLRNVRFPSKLFFCHATLVHFLQ